MCKSCFIKFSILSELSPEIISNIKFVYIFGETGSEVIIVNKEDKVSSFGNNQNGLLGLGHTKNINKPTLIPELCDKQVVDIRYGYNFMLALTKCGHIYSWGKNSVGELGNGSQNSIYSPILITTLAENNITIVDMSCGYRHALILTNMGEVYAFGYNFFGEIGCGNNYNQLIPIKINQIFFNSEKIISISCGSYHSMALSISGSVFSWGYNSNGQLGIGNNIDLNIPKQIKSNIRFNKISCGTTHTLLLSNDGYIYTFGDNSNGQLGNGNKVNQNIPLKLELSVKFNDIATNIFNNISIATTMNGNCYYWGECINGIVITPKETQFKSFHDIFAKFAKIEITYKPFFIKLSELFNNADNYDLKLKIDNKIIYTQKWFLEMFCKNFTPYLPKTWLEKNINEIELTQYSYNAYYSFLKYCYTELYD